MGDYRSGEFSEYVGANSKETRPSMGGIKGDGQSRAIPKEIFAHFEALTVGIVDDN